MNERIRELANECFVITDDGRFDYANEYMVQRFALLIVRECANLTRWQEHGMSVEQRIRLGIYQEIKEHFGVNNA